MRRPRCYIRYQLEWLDALTALVRVPVSAVGTPMRGAGRQCPCFGYDGPDCALCNGTGTIPKVDAIERLRRAEQACLEHVRGCEECETP